MRLERSWLQLEPNAIKKEKYGRVNVISVKSYIDDFGKPYTETKIFDDFASVKQALNSKDILDKQAGNCLEKYDGWKL